MIVHLFKPKSGGYVDKNLPAGCVLISDSVYPLSFKYSGKVFVPLVFVHEYTDPEGYVWACVGVIMPHGGVYWVQCFNVGSERVLELSGNVVDGSYVIKDLKGFVNCEIPLELFIEGKLKSEEGSKK
jgi:hypothetical protein